MKGVTLLAVGRLKSAGLRAAADHYLRLASRLVPISEVEVRDGSGDLPVAERKAVEGKALLARLRPGDRLVALDERGRTLTSRELSAWLTRLLDDPAPLTLVVGGAWGLAPEVLSRAETSLSLSALTLPHELARVVLLEQLYRAAAIARHLPYHHD